MKRTPMKRTAFKRKHEPTVPRAERPMAKLSPATRRGSYAGTTTAIAAKTEPRRNRRLLDLANGAPCLLLVPGHCSQVWDSVVACHSNLSEHGKAGARKADDHYSVWGCFGCHRWLDQGGAPAAEKRRVFMGAHRRQVAAWREIARNPSDEPADRKAAQWALDQLEKNKP